MECTGDRAGIEAWLPSVSVTADREPQPTMEYTVECTGDRAGIEAWLPSVSVTAAREHSQLWNTQWNTLVTEQELKLGFLQCLSLLPESPSQLWNTQWNTLVTEQELKLGFLQCLSLLTESTANYGIHSGIHW